MEAEGQRDIFINVNNYIGSFSLDIIQGCLFETSLILPLESQ